MLDKPNTGAPVPPKSAIGNSEHGNEPPKKKVAKAKEPPGKPPEPRLPASQVNPLAELQRDGIYELTQPRNEDWDGQSQEAIDHYYKQAQSDFFRIVDDYLAQANLATERYKNFSASHNRWRISMIIATGLLAAINICATLELFQFTLFKIPAETGTPRAVTVATALSAGAAFYATILAVLATMEGFLNRGEKAVGFRESRDLLLNRYREYCFKWFYYVEAYGKTGKACMNASRLYHQLIDVDQELRQKLKQLTNVQGREPGGGGKPAGS